MPYALHVDVIPPGGGRISVRHTFYGETEAECEANFAAHAAGCNFLTPAIEEERTEEESEKIDDLDWPDYAEDEDDEEEEE